MATRVSMQSRTAASSLSRHSYDAARLKTSSCGSPAERWSTDMTTTSLVNLPALRSYRYWLAQYRRTWRGSISTTVISPVLYLAAMGRSEEHTSELQSL